MLLLFHFLLLPVGINVSHNDYRVQLLFRVVSRGGIATCGSACFHPYVFAASSRQHGL